MWPEISLAKTEKRHELVLSGKPISERIAKDGLDLSLFSLDSLNYLKISETTLAGIPDEIQKLTNLQSLVLYSNKFEEINEHIFQLDKLKVLDLSRNNIKNVPASIANLTQIVSVNLSSNNIENFPPLTKNSKLSVLDLSSNKLVKFPDICYQELSSLAEVKLNNNEIDEIPCNINVLPALKTLDLSSNKINTVPGELACCNKLKEINLKQNPVKDRRLGKLIEQCRTKQILDYIKQNCPVTNANENISNKSKGKKSKSTSSESSEKDENFNYKYKINVKTANEEFNVKIDNSVKNIREYLVCCIIENVSFTETTFKKFIQIQNKLHDTVCSKRINATIATHDFDKFPPGNLIYTTLQPNAVLIKPLNRTNVLTGNELFEKLQTEANNLRKEKKRNTYSGIHKYLYLIEGKPRYPCLLNGKNEVVSFPPITNSDISKIEVQTKTVFIEISSSTSQSICNNVMEVLIKEIVLLFDNDLHVRQVKIVDSEERAKVVYPSKHDLNYNKEDNVQVIRN